MGLRGKSRNRPVHNHHLQIVIIIVTGWNLSTVKPVDGSSTMVESVLGNWPTRIPRYEMVAPIPCLTVSVQVP